MQTLKGPGILSKMKTKKTTGLGSRTSAQNQRSETGHGPPVTNPGDPIPAILKRALNFLDRRSPQKTLIASQGEVGRAGKGMGGLARGSLGLRAHPKNLETHKKKDPKSDMSSGAAHVWDLLEPNYEAHQDLYRDLEAQKDPLHYTPN